MPFNELYPYQQPPQSQVQAQSQQQMPPKQQTQGEKQISLLKEVINYLQHYHHIHEKMILPAMDLSIEGEKRCNRYYAIKLHDMVLYTICKIKDTFGISVWYDEKETPTVSFKNDVDYFKNELKMFEEEYNDIHELANKLVVNNLKSFSNCLYDLCCEILEDDIWELRRILLRKEALASGKTDHDTAIQECTLKDINRHDKYEKKENK